MKEIKDEDMRFTFCVNKSYPKNNSGKSDKDRRVVLLEISTEHPLPNDFDNELMELISKYNQHFNIN